MMSGNAEIVAAKLYVPATSFDVKADRWKHIVASIVLLVVQKGIAVGMVAVT
jgi:hypothetical protein